MSIVSVRTRLFFLCLSFLIACDSGSHSERVAIRSDFDSGSIGEYRSCGEHCLELSLRDDNEQAGLPAAWRNWWYLRAENLSPGQRISVRIRNRGWRNYYLPVYSENQRDWLRLEEEQVSLSEACASGLEGCYLEFHFSPESESVYFARYYPYEYERLQRFLNQLSENPFVQRERLGLSPEYGKPIELLRIAASEEAPYRVFLHARTHPAETGASFFLEGVIGRLLEDFAADERLRELFAFYIVPMHNIDGVIAGNYRSNTESVNLETSWFIEPGNVEMLANDAPLENQLLQMAMRTFFQEHVAQQGELPVLAINLHSANTEPDTPAFAFDHFGADPQRYTAAEQALWQAQQRLIRLIDAAYVGDFFVGGEAGEGFLDVAFPESWWWAFAGPQSIAMTIETTYGRAGFSRWTTEDDIRALGSAFVEAVYAFYLSGGSTVARKEAGDTRRLEEPLTEFQQKH